MFVGTVLYGFCEGRFGRDGYGDKRIEAIGADWVVVRYIDDVNEGKLGFCAFKDTIEMQGSIGKWSIQSET